MNVCEIDQLRVKLKSYNVYLLAKQAGISARCIYNIINGKGLPSVKTLRKLQPWIK